MASQRTTRTDRLPLGLMGVAAALMLSAMTCQPVRDFRVLNQSGQTLTVTLAGSEAVNPERTVSSGSLTTLPMPDGGCDGSSVVASGDDGGEVARLDQPVCDGQIWIIEEDRAYLDK